MPEQNHTQEPQDTPPPAVKTVMEKQPEIAALCRQNQVARLELFGSAIQATFDPATSDFDFLVEFVTDTPEGAADRFFGLKQGLTDMLGRTVDIVELAAVKNPYFIEAIGSNRLVIYGN